MKYQVTSVLITLVAGCLGHIYMSDPCARGSPLAQCGYPSPNFDLMAPIATENQPTFPLCHHAEPYASPVKTVQAGSSITATFEGTAIHNGGHCEFSLSYDGGKKFVAIQTILKTCFLSGKSFNVPIPKEAPNGKAVFAWSWVNASGKREFYMSCSDIEVQGGGSGSLKGPQMLTPNYDGSSPKIGEFGLSGDDCSNLYTGRPTIEVTSGGAASSPGGQSLYPEVPAPNGTAGGNTSASSTGIPAAGPMYPTATPSTDNSSAATQVNPGNTAAGDGTSASATPTDPPGTMAGNGTSVNATQSDPATTAAGNGTSVNAIQSDPASTAAGNGTSTDATQSDSDSTAAGVNTSADASQPLPTSTATGGGASAPKDSAANSTTSAVPTQPETKQPTADSVPVSDSTTSELATCVATGKSPEYQTVVNGETIKSTCEATLVCKQTSVGGIYCDFP
ncbi:hypothetical protein IWQ62_005463 [Dispira parvispora]|uniref:Chitin-binding type-4 domain-containing protein n=1 Tax=Dispira parvispora TaxID=1520584 RepID=A0A9W8AJZ2_9FUNG|nr:hypothetical protein IWQ62_005463 [Dispira parvispora]